MNAQQLTREDCWAAAHEVLAEALLRIARDRAAGRLSPQAAAHLDRVSPPRLAPAAA